MGRTKTLSKSNGVRKKARQPEPPSGVPNIGLILKRMRVQRAMTIRDVAAAADLSPSFLSAVERGESDISLGRLTRLAECFEHDLGSLLGFTTRLGRPTFVAKKDRAILNRGRGVRYESLRLPGLNFELEHITIDSRTGFRDELSHEGIDVVLVTEGEMILEIDGVDYPMPVGECAVFSATYRHRLRNDAETPAVAVAFTTGRMM